MQLSFAFHILGIIFWIGGLIVLSRYLKLFVAATQNSSEENQGTTSVAGSDGELRTQLVKACKVNFFGFVLPGFFIVLLTGMYQLLLIGMSYYMKQGWFHGKATAIVLLLVVTMIAGLQLPKIERGGSISRGSVAMIQGGTSALALAILLLTYLGRAA